MTASGAVEPESSGASAVSFGWRRGGAVVAMLAVSLACGFSWRSITNFGGYDEWLILSLTSDGIVSFPYANRPIALIWALPGTLLLPTTLAGYLGAHLAYLLATGVLVFFIARRLGGGDPALALVAGTAATVWAPLDPHRLNPLNNVMYSGATFAAVLALFFFLKWAGDGAAVHYLAGLLAAVLASRSYEGTLGLLVLGAPALLLPVCRTLRRSPWRTVIGWEAPMLVLVLLAVVPLLGSSGSYQTSALRLDPSPTGVAGRLVQQLRWHLFPLVTMPPPELASWWVGLAAVCFALVGLWILKARPARLDRARLLRIAAGGLALAIAGWSPMLLTAAINRPARMQGFSAPGVGLMIGAGVALIGSLSGRRWHRPLVVVLGCWVLAAGTARTMALQRGWDERPSFWPVQSRLLRQLVDLAPDLRPSTLVVLVDRDRAFQASFAFRHAVKYLYEGRALGTVKDGLDFLYPSRFGDRSVVIEPWPVIREPWRESVTRYRYDEVLAVLNVDGRLELLDEWPRSGEPGKDAREGYAPSSRIVSGPPPERSRLLGEEGGGWR